MQFNFDQGTNRLRVGYVLLCPTIHRVSLNAPVDIHSCSRLSCHAHTVIRALTHPHTHKYVQKVYTQTDSSETHARARTRTHIISIDPKGKLASRGPSSMLANLLPCFRAALQLDALLEQEQRRLD